MPEPRPLDFDPIAEARRQWTLHGWAAAADGMTAVTSLMRGHQIVLARVDAVLRPFELTFARYELLMLLEFSKSGSLPLSKVGLRLQVHPTSVTSAVDRLVQQRFVTRRPHPTDRRATLAHITARGRSVAKRATIELNQEVFEDLGVSPRSQQGLISSLRELRRTAGDFV